MDPQPGYELRPRGIGEILDLSFRIYRQRFSQVAIIGIVVTTASVAVNLLCQMLMFSGIPQPGEESNPLGLVRFFGATFAAVVMMLVVQLVMYGLGAVTITVAVADAFEGRRSTQHEILSRALPRSGWAVLTSLLVGVLYIAGGMLCLLPGLYAMVVLALAVPLVYLEKLSTFAAVRRSWELITKRGPRGLVSGANWVRVVAIGLVTVIILYVFSLFASVPILAASVVAAARGTKPVATQLGPQYLPLSVLLPLQFAGAVLQGIFIPIVIVPWTLLYYDIRTRHEGLDLQRATASLESAEQP